MIHSGKLERYLGIDQIKQIQDSMKDWYGPPIAVGRTPGRVFAHADGDFSGTLRDGYFSNLIDRSFEHTKRVFMRAVRKQMGQLNAGFASLSDLISEATEGAKRREFQFQKVGATGVVGATNSLWGVGNQPAAGANASNAPAGDAPTKATTGAFFFTNPTGGDTQHFVSGYPTATVGGNTLLLYDRIFQVNKTMASIVAQSVTGAPTRYQNTVNGSPDSAEGNFLFVEVGGTALANTAHNWTVCLYTDQSGNSNITLPALTGNASAIVRRLDHPVGQWFAPLAAGTTGIKELDQMQCSASVSTGVINFVIGHPIAWLPCPVTNMICVTDGINSAFNLTRIFDDAALAFLEVCKPTTTATVYSGSWTSVAG